MTELLIKNVYMKEDYGTEMFSERHVESIPTQGRVSTILRNGGQSEVYFNSLYVFILEYVVFLFIK